MSAPLALLGEMELLSLPLYAALLFYNLQIGVGAFNDKIGTGRLCI